VQPFHTEREAVKMSERDFAVFISKAHTVETGAIGCSASEICRRFGGGSDRNRALIGNEGSSMHGMQIVQSRINTGDCASR
jgi:hypothetical protein